MQIFCQVTMSCQTYRYILKSSVNKQSRKFDIWRKGFILLDFWTSYKNWMNCSWNRREVCYPLLCCNCFVVSQRPGPAQISVDIVQSQSVWEVYSSMNEILFGIWLCLLCLLKMKITGCHMTVVVMMRLPGVCHKAVVITTTLGWWWHFALYIWIVYNI